MDEFAQDLKRLLKRLERLGPWGLAVLVAGTVLLGYYGFLGVRYMSALQRVDSLSAEVRELSASVQRGVGQPAPVAAGAASEQRLADASRPFRYGTTDEIVQAVASAASAAGVSIGTLSLGEAQSRVQGKVLYQAQPVSLRLDGDATQVVRFLTRLRERAPTVAVSDVRLASLEASGTAQVQLLFYLSPQVAPEKKPTPPPAASGKKATR